MDNKYSYGVALCRYNKEKNNRIEILLMKKRYSFYYYNFVMGRYKKHNDRYLQFMFDNMNFSEKVDILGMQFDIMWYRIWLNNPIKRLNIRDLYNLKNQDYYFNSIVNNNTFFKKKTIFEKNFMNDGGKRLINLINRSMTSEIMWEIPKGRKKDKETNIETAIREFKEETLIGPNKYELLYNVKPAIETIKDNNETYCHTYYIACLTSEITPKVDFRNFGQISEVENIKWVSLAEIEFMNMAPNINKNLIKVYKDIIFKFKKYQKEKRKITIP